MNSYHQVITSGPFFPNKQYAGLGDGVMVFVNGQPHVIQNGTPMLINSSVYVDSLSLSELTSRQFLEKLCETDLVKITSTLVEIAKQIQILHELRGNN